MSPKRRLPVSPRQALLLAAMLAAAALRLTGIRWGLPFTFNADEPHLVNTAVAFGAGTLRPYDFKYPTLWPYVLFAAYGVYFLVWSCLGLCHKVSEFAGLFAWRPGGFFLIGRLLAAAFSLAGAVWMGRRELEQGRRWPWAALLLAFSPWIDEVAHSCKPDSLMLLWACGAWLAALRLQRSGERRSHWLCGAFAGLAASTQYTAAPLAVLLVAAHALGPRPRRSRWLLEGLAACAGAFLAASPFIALDFPRFWASMKDFADLARLTSYDPAALRRQVLLNYWSFAGVGSLAGLLALAGLARLAVSRGRLAAVFALAFAAQFLLVTRNPDGNWPRYLLAVFPGLAWLAAEAFDWAARAGRPLLTALLAVLALGPGLLRCAFNDARMTLPDTREQARDWIERNVPQGSVLVLDAPHASPRLTMSRDEAEELAEKVRAAGSPRWRLYRAMADAHPGGGYRLYRLRRGALEQYSGPRQVEANQADVPTIDLRPGLDTARALRVGWIVTSDWGATAARGPELAVFFDELETQAALVKDFVPVPGSTDGPVLRIFKLAR